MLPLPEKANEQTVPEIELPWRAKRGDREADADHQRAEHHRPPDADAVSDVTHHETAEADTEQAQRSRKRRRRAGAAELGGDCLQRNDGDPRRAKRKYHGNERNARHHPGLPGLDRRPCHAFPGPTRPPASGNVGGL
jgi:hypothetical protein